MKRLPAIALFAILCPGLQAAEQATQPECKKELQGHFWPEEANSDHELARKLYQSGELQMCSLIPPKYTIYWKYKWQFVSVNARGLGKSKRAEAAKAAPESH
jgi:hypothetical protein